MLNSQNEFFFFAHRGASGHEPENTLLAVEKAIQLGARWIEVDVFGVDGKLIVIHDERLERTTNGSGYINEHSLEYLRGLDAGKGERIPILEEVLECIDHRAGLNIELKIPGIAFSVVRMLETYVYKHHWSYEDFIISSFHHHELLEVKKIQPRIRTGALLVGIPLGYARFGEELGAYSVHMSTEFVSADFIHDAHGRGLKAFVFTVNTPEELTRMKYIGLDGVFTNYPELANVSLRQL